MTVSLSRLAVSLLATLSVVAIAAAPASATVTARASSGRITANSRDSVFTRGGIGFRCATSTFAGTVAADGLSASVELDFSNGGRTTCNGPLSSCEVTTSRRTPTTITLRSTASTAGRGATLDVLIDANYTLDISCQSGAVVCTIPGPQTIRAAGTITQGTPSRLAANARGIRCTEGGTIDLTGNYTITETITIS